jgi:hypothetical protein
MTFTFCDIWEGRKGHNVMKPHKDSKLAQNLGLLFTMGKPFEKAVLQNNPTAYWRKKPVSI